MEYETKADKLPKVYDVKRRQWVEPRPKHGYISKAIREVIPELAKAPNNSKVFQNANHMALFALGQYEKKLAGHAYFFYAIMI